MINPYSIVGLDLSLTGTGIASCGGARTIKSDSKMEIEPRVDKIWADMQVGIGEVALSFDCPSLYIIEGLAFASKTGKVAERAFLHHFVRWQLWLLGKKFVLVPPTTLKMFVTGKGNAPKEEMVLAAAKLWPEANIKNNNEGDAVGLYHMGALHCMPGSVAYADLPAKNKSALEKVDWK